MRWGILAVFVAATLLAFESEAPRASTNSGLVAMADTPDAHAYAGAANSADVSAADGSTLRATPGARSMENVARPVFSQPEWIPATPQNYNRGRGGEPVQYLVIHYTAISYDRTIKAFQNPKSRVSAHYVVRGDGHVTQMVFETDTAWQAGNAWYNQRSVGIEIELDPVTNPVYTVAQYNAVAGLACQIAARQGFPLDRNHVFGHNEIPGAVGKTDPGPTWGWPHFMWLTSLCAPASPTNLKATFVAQTEVPDLEPNSFENFSVTLRNDSAVAWTKGTANEARLGVTATTDVTGDNWLLPDRPAAQTEAVVPPGGSATFNLDVGGRKVGVYTLNLRPVVDGVAWMPDIGLHAVVKVKEKEKETGLAP